MTGRQGEADGGTETLNDLGLDFKYSVTSNLTLDATLNPDFAQVEADNVQINLTRFGLFFPEKREFFLERAGLFDFGDPRETQIFFSRRIGITNDIAGGTRLTGQAGPISVGALSLFTDDARDVEGRLIAGGLNSVLRLRADPFPRTTVGGIFTSLDTDDGASRVVGGDMQLRFGGSTVRGWMARSSESGSASGGSASASSGSGGASTNGATAGTVEVDLRNELLSAGGSFAQVPAEFNPALGFVRRRDIRTRSGSVAAFPRFEQSEWARQLITVVSLDHIAGMDGEKQSTFLLSHNMLTFDSGDRMMLNITRRGEVLRQPVRIQGRELAPGDYVFSGAQVRFNTNDSREFSARGGFSRGGFWGGTGTEVAIGGMWKTGPYLTLSGDYTRNDISLPVDDGDFTTSIFSLTVLAAVSRSLFANALVQYDDVSNQIQANVRVNWIHTPGSDLFVVFDTGYLTGDLLDPRTERWQRRTGVVKLTYMKAF